MRGVVAWWRRDGLALLLFAVVVCVATYPLIAYLTTRLTSFRGPDILAAYWQNWSLVKTVTQGLDPNHTPYLFHPNGLDVTLQPRRWVGLFFWWPLSFV